MPMSKKNWLKLAAAGTFLIVGWIAWNVYLLFHISMDNLPAGSPLGRFESPDKQYVVVTYLCSGDMSDFAVRAAVSKNGQWWVFPKNIYWDYHRDNATVKWLDGKTVDINGIVLNVEHDEYDWRVH